MNNVVNNFEKLEVNPFISFLLEEGCLYKCTQGRKFWLGGKRSRQIVNHENYLEIIQKGLNIAIDLSKTNYVGIDIDNPSIAEAVLQLVRDEKLNIFATTYPSGGAHLFFKEDSRSSEFSESPKNKISKLTFRYEFFRNGNIVLLGPGYDVISFPSNTDLDPIPSYFLPVTEGKRSPPWAVHNVFLEYGIIKEGARNNTLFELSKIIRANPDKFPEPKLYLQLFSLYFCDPPYKDGTDHMLEPPSSTEYEEEEEEKKQKSGIKFKIESFVESVGYFKFVYLEVDKTFYVSNESTQLWVAVSEIALRGYLWKICMDLYSTHLSLAAMRNLIEELKTWYRYEEENFLSSNGIGFRNGWMNFERLELEPHSKKRFCTEIVQWDYDQEAKPSDFFIKTMNFWTNYDPVSINVIRGFIARALLRPLWFRSALFLTGPPKSGKSTFIGLLQEIFQHELQTFTCKKNRGFDRGIWKTSRVLVVNDARRIDQFQQELIRQLTGSDLITYEIKFEQFRSEQCFRYSGIFIVVSNLSRDELLTQNEDVALANRFIEVPFTSIPKGEEVNTQIISMLMEGVSGIINWALHVQTPVMQALASGLRVGNDEGSSFAHFISQHLYAEPDAMLYNRDLICVWEIFREQNDLPVVKSLTNAIIDEAATTFNYAIERTRKRDGRGLKNVRVVKTGEDSNFIFAKTELFKNLDPWEMKKVFSLVEFYDYIRDMELKRSYTSHVIMDGSKSVSEKEQIESPQTEQKPKITDEEPHEGSDVPINKKTPKKTSSKIVANKRVNKKEFST
jgi:hypothetical protein